MLYRVAALEERRDVRWIDARNLLSRARSNELVVNEETNGLLVFTAIRGCNFYEEIGHNGGAGIEDIFIYAVELGQQMLG